MNETPKAPAARIRAIEYAQYRYGTNASGNARPITLPTVGANA